MLLRDNKIFKEYREKYKSSFGEISIPAKTILLHEGDVARKIYFIKEGCLRMAYNNKGKDITFQFFFDGQAVASIDSLISGQPSRFSIESIEPSLLSTMQKEDFTRIMRETPELKEAFSNLMYSRLEHYSDLFLSFIKDTPEERYLELIKNEPQILKRVPQHYIASYLGITPVSLSRIRAKLLKK